MSPVQGMERCKEAPFDTAKEQTRGPAAAGTPRILPSLLALLRRRYFSTPVRAGGFALAAGKELACRWLPCAPTFLMLDQSQKRQKMYPLCRINPTGINSGRLYCATCQQQQRAPEAVPLCPIGEASPICHTWLCSKRRTEYKTPLDDQPRENILTWGLGTISVTDKPEGEGALAFKKMGLG